MKHKLVFSIEPIDPTTHEFAVTLVVPSPDANGQVLKFAAWIPGSYMIRDFARNLLDIKATTTAGEVAIAKRDKQTWVIASCPGPLTVTYRVYAWDMSVRAAYLDTLHGYFNGTSVFLLPVGFESEPLEVELLPPPPGFSVGWQVATTLMPVKVSASGFGRYRAANYDDLLDHPVEMANVDSLNFAAAGVPHQVVLTGRQQCDHARLSVDLASICEEHAAMFGGALPFDRYLFLVWVVGDAYGGLEHRDSCSLLCARTDLPTPLMEKPSEGYIRFLGLCSHEYFHAWNVKRIRPAVFRDQALSREVYTTLLWAFEGITSYYDDLALLRSGRIELEGYLGLIAKTVTRVMRGPGHRRQSAAESSFDAWTKFYKQDENAPNAIVSYYAKGALVAFGLDMTLRECSDERFALDDLMREMWRRHGLTGEGVSEGDIERLAETLVGANLNEFFKLAVYGTSDLPLTAWFASLGIGYRLRPAANQDDQGGYLKTLKPPKPTVEPGWRFRQQGELLQLTQVINGGAAQRAGLAAGDCLVAVDGLKVDGDSLQRMVSDWTSERAVTVHAFRRDELMTFALSPRLASDDTCDLWLLPEEELSVAQIRRRQAWKRSSVSADRG